MKRYFVAAILALTLTGCATVTNNPIQNIKEKPGQAHLYSCGMYMCTTVTVCAEKACETIPNVAVDTGSPGLRLYDNAVTGNLKKALLKKWNDLGGISQLTTFEDFKLTGKYTKAQVQLGGFKPKYQHMELENMGLLDKTVNYIICGCNGILGISNVSPVSLDNITKIDNMKKYKPNPQVYKFVVMESPLLGHSYTIAFKKDTALLKEGIKLKKAEGQSKKAFGTIVDTGSPVYLINIKWTKNTTLNIIGLKKLYGKTVYFYLDGTMIDNTMYYSK